MKQSHWDAIVIGVGGVGSAALYQLAAAGLRVLGCMYTMTADEHFVVDRHPLDPNVCFAAGLSGHGFKFASVLGEILADWAQGKSSQLPTEFLAANRGGIR